jgi:aconitate hydratase
VTFVDPEDYSRVEPGDFISIVGLHRALREGRALELTDRTRGLSIGVKYELSPRQVEMVLAGGLIPLMLRRSEPSTSR